jgi:hypothetical protein
MEGNFSAVFDRSITLQQFSQEPRRWLECVSRGEIESLRIELEDGMMDVSLERDAGASLATRLRVEEAVSGQLAMLASAQVNIDADRLLAIAREEQQQKFGLTS